MQIKAMVIACFGNQAQIYSPENPNLPLCQLKKNLSLVAGEEIICELKNNQAIFIKKVSKATDTKYFYRYSKQKLKPLAANIDHLVIVVASLPAPLSILIDSFLILAETQSISASLVFNKADLPRTNEVEKLIKIYRSLGYPFFLVSAQTGFGIDELKSHLQHKKSAFCGASGVGKSSLLNALMKNTKATIGEIGKSHGRHTTSAAQVYINADFTLIDLPGANRILPDKLSEDIILRGYIELRSLINTCKFRDCSHSGDLGCQLKKAYEKSLIHPLRWQNLQKLLHP